jgi:hypothetical protein
MDIAEWRNKLASICNKLSQKMIEKRRKYLQIMRIWVEERYLLLYTRIYCTNLSTILIFKTNVYISIKFGIGK